MPLLPVRKCFSRSSRNGSLAISALLTSRCPPLSTSVTKIAARRAARSPLSAERRASFTSASWNWSWPELPRACLFDFLHVYPDGAAAGEPDLPSGLVGNAELERLGAARIDHVERLGDHGALHAAARDRAEKVALIVDDQI